MNHWRMIRLLLAWMTFGLSCSAQAAAGDLQVISTRQTQPGKVQVIVAHGRAAAPTAAELTLRLGSSEVRASSVSAQPAPEAPTWLLLCVDRSGSIGAQALAELKTALAEALSAQGRVQLPFKADLLAIGSQTQHLLGFTDRTPEIVGAIARLSAETRQAGQTRLYDAIAGGMAELRAQGDGAKRLIVMSDGEDDGSTLSASQVAKLAQAAFPIDAIAYGPRAAENSGNLSILAGATGGRFVQTRSGKEITSALISFLSGIVAPSFTVAFDYPASSDNRLAERPMLLYAAAGQPTLERTLDVGLAAPAYTASTPGTDEAGKDTGKPPGMTIKLWLTVRAFVRSVPLAAWLVAAALLAALAALAARRRRPPPVDGGGTSSNGSVPVPGVTVVNPKPARPAARGATRVGFAWPAPEAGRPTAILRGISGQVRGAQFQVDKPVLRIGCAAENDVVLVGDDFASGMHALLRADSNDLYVEDLGSTNGTFLNDAQFKSATRALSPGDELRFGHSTFRVLPVQAVDGSSGKQGYEPAPL
jgi:hypothetical protein